MSEAGDRLDGALVELTASHEANCAGERFLRNQWLKTQQERDSLGERLAAADRQHRDLQADKRVLHDEMEHLRMARKSALEAMAALRSELLRFRDSLHDGSQYYAEGIKAALDSIVERHCE